MNEAQAQFWGECPEAGASQALDRYAFRRLVSQAGQRLAQAGVNSPEHDARALAEFVLGVSLVRCEGAAPQQVGRFLELIERRAQRVPLQHLTGRMWFRGLELVSRPGVFIVRPETEVVAGAAIAAASGAAGALAAVERAPVVVDLCTGSGAIAAAVAVEVPRARVLAVEIDAAAVALARENCERLAPGRVEVFHGDATAVDGGSEGSELIRLAGRVDVVVSNPPYVPPGAIEDAETTRHDPDLALFGGGAQGLEVPLGIVRQAAALLAPGGVLVMEHDPGQARILCQAARELGFAQVKTGVDLTGRDRYLWALR